MKEVLSWYAESRKKDSFGEFLAEGGRPMKKRKAYPGSLYDLYGVEQWLTQLAREGLRLEKFSSYGSIGVFEQGEPKRIRYHVEPDFSTYRDAEDEDSLGEGWNFVCKVSGVFLVYETEDPWTAKPGKWKIEDQYLRKKQRSLWLSFFLWIVTTGLAGWKVMKDLFPQRVDYLDWLQLLPLVFVSSGLLALVEVWKGLPMLYDIWVWRRSFLMEEEVEQHRVMAAFRWGEQWLFPVVIAVAIIAVIVSLGETSRHFKPLEEYDKPLPLVTLDVTEDVIHYAPKPYGPSIDVSVKHRLLIPEDILISSQGLYENPGDIDAWVKGRHLERPDAEMRFSYYRLWTEGMASKLAKNEAENIEEYYDSQKMPHDQFDELWMDNLKWMGHAESQKMVAREGDVVISIYYYGDEQLEEHLDEIYGIVIDYRNR